MRWGLIGGQKFFRIAFLAKFGNAVITVAKKRGLLFVLNQDSGVLVYADPTPDITKGCRRYREPAVGCGNHG